MSDDLVYDGRARKRPPGANSTVIEIFDLLDTRPEGITLEEACACLRAGFPTDAYRAYEQYLKTHRQRRKSLAADSSRGQTLKPPPPMRQFGAPDFKLAAERWWVQNSLKKMVESRTARREDDRWFRGERAPLVQIVCEAGHRHMVSYDSKKGRAEDEARVHRAHVREAARKVLAEPRLSKAARKVIEQLLEIS